MEAAFATAAEAHCKNMYEILTGIQAVVFFITILGCIPYGIWIIHSLWKKRWRRAIFQAAIPIVFFAILAGVSVLCESKIKSDYLVGLFDTEVKLAEPLFQYDSERAFNGDGYSIEVYELPEAIRKRFESVDERLLAEFPKHPSYRNHWKFEPWREAPLEEKFQDHLNFALSGFDSDHEAEIAAHYNSIRKALHRRGTYYAFFYNSPSKHIGDIDFFVVDLVEGRLYIINCNT